MIPWFFDVDEMKKFQNMSPKKREKIILKHREHVANQRRILDKKIEQTKIEARSISKNLSRQRNHQATEAMMTVAHEIQTVEPVLTNYVNNFLLLRVYETMHIEGYVDPNALPDAMADIDYGLYSLSTEDEMRVLLSQATNPLSIIGIELD